MASIARRSGEVLSIDAQIVYEKDDFTLVYGLEQSLEHKPCLDDDPGAMRGAYCVVKFKDGSYQYKFMTKGKIDEHRRRSKASGSGPWVSDYEEMAKKTVFRSLFKWLPLSIEDSAVVSKNDEAAARLDSSKTGEDALEIEFVAATDEETAVEPEAAQ